jgi:hypothetical protein
MGCETHLLPGFRVLLVPHPCAFSQRCVRVFSAPQRACALAASRHIGDNQQVISAAFVSSSSCARCSIPRFKEFPHEQDDCCDRR